MDELLRFLEATLPGEWVEAAEAGDDGALRSLRRGLDVRAVIARLGAAGGSHRTGRSSTAAGVSTSAGAGRVRTARSLERAAHPRGSGFVLAAPAIRAFSEEATKRRFLPRIVTGEEQWAQLFSEPGAGSDLASLATRAVRDGDEWVVNGQKVWTTLAQESQFAMLLARTDPDVPKHDGITYFGVDLRAPGVDVRPLRQITGETEFNEVFLTDVRIPDLYRISPIGEGWAASHATLSAERLTLSGTSSRQRQSRGILGGKTIDEVLELARSSTLAPIERASPGAGLHREQAAGADRRALRRRWILGVRRRSHEDRQGDREQGSAGARRPPARCPRDGLAEDDAEAARYNREFLRTRANSIEGGTSEIQRNVIGERVLGLPREPDAYKGRPWSEVPRS